MLKQRAIFSFWLPLALSAMLMSVEGPWIQAVISRKPDAALHLAAFGLVVTLSVTIETPVIMLLATSSALSRNKQAFQVLWRFMMALNIGLTVIHLLMAFTPLLDLYLGRLLGIPANLIAAARPGMGIMILWTAFIGFRRFYQGILIRSGKTRSIGIGTMIRVVVSGGVALLCGALTDMSGTNIGSLALVMAVAAEAMYAYRICRPTANVVLARELPAGAKALTYVDVLRFHTPLAVTSLLTLLVRPIIDSGLASTSNAELSLAAFPVIYSLVSLLRAGGFAMQEVIITLGKGDAQVKALYRFSWLLGLSISGFMLVFALSPLLHVYIATILSVPEQLRPMIATGTQLAVLLPLLSTLQSHWRALLMLTGHTPPVYQAMGLGFLVTAVTIGGGLRMGIDGIIVASAAMTIGSLVELAYLWRAFGANAGKLEGRWRQEALLAGD